MRSLRSRSWRDRQLFQPEEWKLTAGAVHRIDARDWKNWCRMQSPLGGTPIRSSPRLGSNRKPAARVSNLLNTGAAPSAIALIFENDHKVCDRNAALPRDRFHRRDPAGNLLGDGRGCGPSKGSQLCHRIGFTDVEWSEQQAAGSILVAAIQVSLQARLGLRPRTLTYPIWPKNSPASARRRASARRESATSRPIRCDPANASMPRLTMVIMYSGFVFWTYPWLRTLVTSNPIERAMAGKRRRSHRS